MKRRTVVVGGVLLALTALVAFDLGDAWARAGGGGSRGSRSFSAPARPAPMPSSPAAPNRSTTPASPAAPAPARPGWAGGLLGGLAGFALGGLLGSMLFGGLGGLGGGIGLFDMLLVGGGIALLVMWMKRRREAAAPTPAHAYAGSGAAWSDSSASRASSVGTMEMPAGSAVDAATADLERGLGHVRQMDARFDPAPLAAQARATFAEVQRAVSARDVSPLRDRIAPEMYGVLQRQCDRLRGEQHVNHVEAIDVREADVTEIWQEMGRDFVTLRLAGTLVDYTMHERTGAVVEGSRTPQAFEEFWTFTRPVGPNAWTLSAIQAP
jgi:predicted lipid-binding transport protein (Tim44 family)